MNAVFTLSLILFLLALTIRTTYEILKKGRGVNTKALFPFMFTVMCLLWFSWFAMSPLDPVPVEVPQFVRWGGFGVFVVGWILALTALVQLRGLEDIDHLVTSGLFSRLRHPMYTGFLCWIAGWGMYHGAAISLLAGIVGMINILYWRSLEEAALESRYGEVYRKYRLHTWF